MFFGGKIVGINALILLGIIGVLAVFDWSLELGGFHGVVFTLYLWYAAGLIFLINAGLAVYFSQKAENTFAKYYWGCAFFFSLFAIVISQVVRILLS